MNTDASHQRHVLEAIVAQTNGVARVRELIDQGKVDGDLGRAVIKDFILDAISAAGGKPEEAPNPAQP